jgi:MYXO-CTERM domain-containing protein
MKWSVAAVGLLAGNASVRADNECRNVTVQFVPSDDLQIVAWIEDALGHYIDTAFITEKTGLRGLGNRSGIMGLHSGPNWPYGARQDVLPIWAHRHGIEFPEVVWQADIGCDIDTAFSYASVEPFYNRPLMPSEPQWDTGTAASTIFTDKGRFGAGISHYPPRGDLDHHLTDSDDVFQYAALDVFDAVSRATPPGDLPYEVQWVVPSGLPAGDYVLRVEAAKEYDFNATYAATTFPMTQCRWLDYGKVYRGQPSVLYDVPFSIGATDTVATTESYAGYSDLDGNVHAPDATMTTDTPSSGASRLHVVSDNGSLYRVRVATHLSGDATGPAKPRELAVTELETTAATISFRAPGDDDESGTVSRYDIRYRIGDTISDANFRSSTPVPDVTPLAAGERQQIALTDLAPGTPYSVGIRAYDDCGHASDLVVIDLETPTAEVPVGCGCNSSDPASGLTLIAFAAFARRRKRRQRGAPRD